MWVVESHGRTVMGQVMKVSLESFNPDRFSFHKDPVLIIDNFWSEKERNYFQEAMQRVSWKTLAEMPKVQAAFPNCGNWLKADITQAEASTFLERLTLPCIIKYIESFPDIKRRHMNFNYYSYAAGDCLSTHDDTDEAYAATTPGQPRPPLRRIALATYLHHEWRSDWGGELIIYAGQRPNPGAQPDLSITHCIEPSPGSLVLFTVPRFHRVCRVDPLAGEAKRLSIAGWFMTEH